MRGLLQGMDLWGCAAGQGPLTHTPEQTRGVAASGLTKAKAFTCQPISYPWEVSVLTELVHPSYLRYQERALERQAKSPRQTNKVH